MPVYWTLFFISLIMYYIEEITLSPNGSISNLTPQFYKKERTIALITLIPLLFFLAFRDFVQDTYAYVAMFKVLPNISEIADSPIYKSYGPVFSYYAAIFKYYIVDNHYWWFALLASINIWCIYKVCVKYSPNIALSIFFFIAGTTFTWCLNGTRQFLAVTLLFYFSKYLLKDKKYWYIVIVFLCSFIHRSAIFLIPLAFVVSSEKLYGKGMLLVVLATLVGVSFSDAILGSAMEIIGKQYVVEEGQGSTVLRLLFTCVPVALSIINIKTVKRLAPKAIILGLNMSLIGSCFMFVATFTSGILIGRMPAYFNIYNLYVLPWLLYNCFPNTNKLVINVFIIVYTIWFYFQMCVAWRGLPYVSEALNLYYF